MLLVLHIEDNHEEEAGQRAEESRAGLIIIYRLVFFSWPNTVYSISSWVKSRWV